MCASWLAWEPLNCLTLLLNYLMGSFCFVSTPTALLAIPYVNSPLLKYPVWFPFSQLHTNRHTRLELYIGTKGSAYPPVPTTCAWWGAGEAGSKDGSQHEPASLCTCREVNEPWAMAEEEWVQQGSSRMFSYSGSTSIKWINGMQNVQVFWK